MTLKILATILISLSIIVFPAVIVKDGVHEVESIEVDGEIFLKADELDPLGFDHVAGDNVFYLMFGDHTLVLRKNGVVTVDFVERDEENACVFREDGFYISLKLINEYLNLSWDETPRGEPIGMEEFPKVVVNPLGEGKLNVSFDGDFSEKMIDVRKDENGISILVSPVSSVDVYGDIPYRFTGRKLEISLRTEIPSTPRVVYNLKGTLIEYELDVSNFFGMVKLADGIIWTRSKEIWRGRTHVIDYVEVDLKKAHIEPVLASGGVGRLESVVSMVRRTGALVGVNANYFDPRTGFIVGLLMINGEIISGRYGYRPILFITDDGAYISNGYMEVVAALGDVKVLVNAVNAPSKLDVVMYTQEYSKRIPKDDWRMYFLIEGGVIRSRTFKSSLGEGEILIGVDKKYSKAFKNVKPGDEFDLEVRTPIHRKILHAVEGGPFLIKGGRPFPKPADEKSLYGGGIVSSRRARTIVALKNPYKIVLIVIEDGGSGMNYDDMVDFLKGKGFTDAMCLDGGSSSTLVVKGKPVNFQPDEKVPAVPVGLLVWGGSE